MQPNKTILQFLLLLIASSGIAFWLQNLWSEPNEHLSLTFTYSFNLIFTVPVLIIMILMFKSLKRYIGFIFLGLGFIKVVSFLIYTKINAIDINRDNFLLFFVPYMVCMFVEVLVLSRLLNRANF